MTEHQIAFGETFDEDFSYVKQYIIDNGFDENIPQKIIDEITDRLERFPNIGEVYSSDIRKITIMRKNVVYYRVQSNQIQVLHIKSGLQSKKISK